MVGREYVDYNHSVGVRSPTPPEAATNHNVFFLGRAHPLTATHRLENLYSMAHCHLPSRNAIL